MANYKIIGADLVEYGPVSAEQIRQWIAEGRVDSQTKLQAEGGGEWKRLAEMPEFTEALPGTALTACPTCGEPFEIGGYEPMDMEEIARLLEVRAHSVPIQFLEE